MREKLGQLRQFICQKKFFPCFFGVAYSNKTFVAKTTMALKNCFLR